MFGPTDAPPELVVSTAMRAEESVGTTSTAALDSTTTTSSVGDAAQTPMMLICVGVTRKTERQPEVIRVAMETLYCMF